MKTSTSDDLIFASAVMRACLHLRGRDEPNKREVRAIEIVANFALRRSGRVWYVRSQSGVDEYRIKNGLCNCPDESQHCKHLVAVDLLRDYAEELVRRLDRHEWDETVEDAKQLQSEYVQLLQAAKPYRPPDDGLLTAFRLEAVGDDAWRQKRTAQRAGQQYVPLKTRDLNPERPWIAHLNGLSARYEFDRGFLRGNVDYREADKRGSRGVYLYFNLPPGLYEVYERLDHYKSKRYFARVADLKIAEVSKREVLSWMTAHR